MATLKTVIDQILINDVARIILVLKLWLWATCESFLAYDRDMTLLAMLGVARKVEC